MRKLLFLLPLCLLIREASAQRFEGGVFAGAVASQINGDGLAGFDLPGFQVGVFSALPWREHSRFKLELVFAQKGAQQLPSDTANIQYKARLNYIDLNLLFNYRYKQLSFEIGPVLSFLVNATESDLYGEYEPVISFQTFHLAGQSGINYHFTDQWHVSFRSGVSIFPARKTGGSPTPNRSLLEIGTGQYNLWLAFGVNYRFGRP